MALVLSPGLRPDFISWLWRKISLKKSVGTRQLPHTGSLKPDPLESLNMTRTEGANLVNLTVCPSKVLVRSVLV